MLVSNIEFHTRNLLGEFIKTLNAPQRPNLAIPHPLLSKLSEIEVCSGKMTIRYSGHHDSLRIAELITESGNL